MAQFSWRKAIIPALLGSAVTILLSLLAFSAWYGGINQWRETVDHSLEEFSKLDETIDEHGRAIYKLQNDAPDFGGINSNSERTIIDGNLVVLNNKWGTEKTSRSTGGGTLRGQAECPEGQFVTAIEVLDADGGRHCTSCLTAVRLTCAPL